MKILIVGGTVFLGRFMVEAALARGHEVTLFNRGKSNADLFPNVEKLHGDRNGDLAPLRNRRWDVVFDTSGYVPRHVRNSAQLLRDQVEHYTFVSSISVYGDINQIDLTEEAPVATLKEETEAVTGETYGPLKALCEQAVEAAMPGQAAVLRAGLIVGPYDYTGRFPYWVKRIAAGGEVLAPGRPGRQVQLIDVRDLATWAVRLAEARTAGVFNATGPDYRLPMSRMLDQIKEGVASDASFTWVSDEFLLKESVGPWQEMPFWLPEGQNLDGHLALDVSKAVAAGLTFRPVADTARDTLAWINQHSDSQKLGERAMDLPPAGLDRTKERMLLEKWHALAPTP